MMVGGGGTKAFGGMTALGGTIMVPSLVIGIPPIGIPPMGIPPM